jgi:hypothetical protein
LASPIRLAETTALTVVSKRAAMPASVSPGRTV